MKVKNPAEVKSKPERRYDIDWLRVLAMLSLFLFHCARFFDYEDWHVKIPKTDVVSTSEVQVTNHILS